MQTVYVIKARILKSYFFFIYTQEKKFPCDCKMFLLLINLTTMLFGFIRILFMVLYGISFIPKAISSLGILKQNVVDGVMSAPISNFVILFLICSIYFYSLNINSKVNMVLNLNLRCNIRTFYYLPYNIKSRFNVKY